MNPNPPAFPHVTQSKRAGSDTIYTHVSEGMTLRDWFAGQLAAAEVASAGANEFAAEALGMAAHDAGQTIEQRIAFNAYRVAGAMITERGKGK